MIARNHSFRDIAPSYLFAEVRKRKEQFQLQHPDTKWIPLGIGDTTEPLVPAIVQSLHDTASRLANKDTYTGYGPDLGIEELRKTISQVLYSGIRSCDEIIVSDGAKCDLGRLQMLFGSNVPVALPDPSYPVYYDSSFLMRGKKGSIQLLPSNAETHFLPDLSKVQEGSLIFLCSPNNPTGKVFQKSELRTIVEKARQKKCVILYDVAYRSYIQSPELPRSIFEIEGADDVAIEIGSFSKMAGFSGIRLGWMALSKKLVYDTKEPLLHDIARLMGTLFNGASIISQQAGIAALSPDGQQAIQQQVQNYIGRAHRIKETLLSCNVQTYGGEHSPYVWIYPKLGSSWEAFDTFLSHGLVTTPGVGFGPSGEGFLRLSSFLKEELVEEACERLKNVFDGTLLKKYIPKQVTGLDAI